MDGMSRVGVLAPRAQLGRGEKVTARVFHVVAYRCTSPLAPPLIFIEHANGLLHRRPISTLI
jgi:hypothetical protein